MMDEDVEDAEIIDDEDDMEAIQRNKAHFQYRQLQEASSKKQKTSDIPDTPTPSASATVTKNKFSKFDKFATNPEDTQSEQGSAMQSKIKQTELVIENEGIEKLKEHLLCVSCCTKPKCMLIQACRHVPFCKDCDNSWRMQSQKAGQGL